MDKNYYQILGIDEKASGEEIKKAFHKLAHRYHPDKKGGDEAKFKEVNEAFHILSNNQKRAQYDAVRKDGGPGGGFGWDFSNFSRAGSNSGFQFDFGDIFSDLFSGGVGDRVRRGRDISVDIQIPFVDAVFGTERKILITKIGECDTCRGTGAKPGSKTNRCASCGGQGKTQETRRSFLGSFSTLQDCSSCRGRGDIPEVRCETCSGLGVLRKTEEVKITVPPGVESGEMIRLTGRGEAVAQGVAGDLYVRVHVDRHSLFRREGANLLTDLSIRLSDALLGAEYPLKTLDGEIKIKIPAGINSGEVLRVKGKGVGLKTGRRGDLLIKIIVKIPAKISRKSREIIEKLREEGL